MSEINNVPTIDDLNNVLNTLKEAIEEIEYPDNYSDSLKEKLKNDFFNITVKISNHPKFNDVERFISVNNVEISFGLIADLKKHIKMTYTTIYVKDGEDISDEFSQYNPPIVGDKSKLMLPRMMDGTPITHYNKYVIQQPPQYDANGNRISEGGETIREDLLKFPMYDVMMPLFNAPISDRDIVIAFVKENDIDGYFNR